MLSRRDAVLLAVKSGGGTMSKNQVAAVAEYFMSGVSESGQNRALRSEVDYCLTMSLITRDGINLSITAKGEKELYEAIKLAKRAIEQYEDVCNSDTVDSNCVTV